MEKKRKKERGVGRRLMKNIQREGSREKKLCSVCACVSAQGEWVR